MSFTNEYPLIKSKNKFVQKLEEEIRGKNRKDVINELEKIISENIEKLSKNEEFYNLPLNNIFSVISKVDFDLIEDNEKIIESIQNIVNNIMKTHLIEKETVLILQYINTQTITLSFDEIFSILELIKNCPLLVNFCKLYKEQKQLIDRDYDYELEQKDKEIEKLKKEILEIKYDSTNKIKETKTNTNKETKTNANKEIKTKANKGIKTNITKETKTNTNKETKTNVTKERKTNTNKETKTNVTKEIKTNTNKVIQSPEKGQTFEIKFQPVKKRPKNYESNIFTACRKGNLESVQWLIEKKFFSVSPNIKDKDDFEKKNATSYSMYRRLSSNCTISYFKRCKYRCKR